MPDEKKKCECCKDELKEVKDEDLENVNGGKRDENGLWICPFCSAHLENINSNKDINIHYEGCDRSPFYVKK